MSTLCDQTIAASLTRCLCLLVFIRVQIALCDQTIATLSKLGFGGGVRTWRCWRLLLCAVVADLTLGPLTGGFFLCAVGVLVEAADDFYWAVWHGGEEGAAVGLAEDTVV
jgi:hypothetical protein